MIINRIKYVAVLLSVLCIICIVPISINASSIEYHPPSNYNTLIDTPQEGYIVPQTDNIIKIVGTRGDGSILKQGGDEVVISKYAIYFVPNYLGKSDEGNTYIISTIDESHFPNGTFGVILLEDSEDPNITYSFKVNRVLISKSILEDGNFIYSLLLYDVESDWELSLVLTSPSEFDSYEEQGIACLNIDTVELDAPNSIEYQENDVEYEYLRTFFNIPIPTHIEFTNNYKNDIYEIISTIIDEVQSMFSNETYVAIVEIFMAFAVASFIFFLVFKIWR